MTKYTYIFHQNPLKFYKYYVKVELAWLIFVSVTKREKVVDNLYNGANLKDYRIFYTYKIFRESVF